MITDKKFINLRKPKNKKEPSPNSLHTRHTDQIIPFQDNVLQKIST